MDLQDRGFLQALYNAALEQSFEEIGAWSRAYKELAYAANVLDALLARAERENLCDTCRLRVRGSHYCDASDCVIHHKEQCESYYSDTADI